MTSPKCSDPLLRRRFLALNKKYFTNSIPRDTMVVWLKSKDLMGMATPADAGTPPMIFIERSLSKLPKVWEFTLLHEMAHLSSEDPSHSPDGAWHREMMRLARAGAFDHIW